MREHGRDPAAAYRSHGLNAGANAGPPSRIGEAPGGSVLYGRRMTVTISAMFISVHDPDEALGFYRDALGLEVRNDVSAGGFRWVTVGAPGPGRRHRLVPAARRPLAGRGRRARLRS